MPYTPPSQQSPASSKTTTPALSRSSSYIDHHGPPSPSVSRPTPPRSMSSTSYLHKHRRSPSITKVDDVPLTPTEAENPKVDTTDFAHLQGLRQSPPPVNNLRIPTGAVLSPPDSAESSDDGSDNSASHERGRELEKSWNELQQAVRLIDQKRSGSPEKMGVPLSRQPQSEPHSQTTSPTALTQEARKISHSRSSTETAILKPKQHFESPSQGSDDSDEDENLSKPSLVRKKSGELVKPALRPSSRRRYSSMPGTPTYSKSVHFNESNNQTRHFLQVDKPMAVSAGSSPVETYDSESEFPFEGDNKPEREIRLANFPADSFDRKTKPIRVERIFLSPDKQTLIGVCAVQNISLHKLVVARFTLDYWKTTSEVVAEYNNNPKDKNADGCDRFNFQIKLSDQANVDNKTILLCVRYNVGGQEYWDNNDDGNYQIDFSNVMKKSQKPAVTGLGARPLNALPRSRHSPTGGARGHRESLDDDFATRFDTSSTYSFGTTDQLLGESPNSIKLKPRAKRGSLFPTATATAQPANGLGGRYDFGASLSAALTQAQDKLGRQSGLMNDAPKPNGGSYFGPMERVEGPTKTEERPDAITTDRPAMGSDQYKDLVQKFCYFTPGSAKGPSSPPQTGNAAAKSTQSQPGKSTDGTQDSASVSSSSSNSSSASPLMDGSNEPPAAPAFSPFISRSGSPAPVTGGLVNERATSPISFGYPYHHNLRDGYLSDSQTPTAIQG